MIFIKKFTSFFLSLLLNLNVLVPGNVNAESDSPKKVSCKPRMTQDKIDIAKTDGYFENSDTKEEDGFNYELICLDNFLNLKDIGESTKAHIEKTMWDKAYNQEHISSLDYISKTWQKRALDPFGLFLEDINYVHSGNEIDAVIAKVAPKDAMDEVQKGCLKGNLTKDQNNLAKDRENILTSSKYTPTPLKTTAAIFAGGTATGYALSTGGIAGANALGMKTAAALMSNPATFWIGAGLGVGLTLWGCYTLYKNDVQRKILDEYQSEASKLAKLEVELRNINEQEACAIENGKWVGKNGFRRIYPISSKCDLNARAEFIHVPDFEQPSDFTIDNLSQMTCSKKKCTKFEECAYFLDELDNCIREKTSKCKSLVTLPCNKSSSYTSQDFTSKGDL